MFGFWENAKHRISMLMQMLAMMIIMMTIMVMITMQKYLTLETRVYITRHRMKKERI